MKPLSTSTLTILSVYVIGLFILWDLRSSDGFEVRLQRAGVGFAMVMGLRDCLGALRTQMGSLGLNVDDIYIMLTWAQSLTQVRFVRYVIGENRFDALSFGWHVTLFVLAVKMLCILTVHADTSEFTRGYDIFNVILAAVNVNYRRADRGPLAILIFTMGTLLPLALYGPVGACMLCFLLISYLISIGSRAFVALGYIGVMYVALVVFAK